ncbi:MULTISPECIES: flagellar protein FlbA [unclassified Borrelia]|uniref:flagellar protein FlbA n=1 Tax=unclassified Borrelia TaxID=2649934 RepID=UPI001E5E2638|nr:MULTISPECIES: flagellar protein FlbA [unclassified Borrelia]UGQ15979.1 flagellar protein FlbA [Borrelia sp. RT5S]UGQ17089.1 flagellar protein FlbA [Borrelia sp. RT1S]
MNNLILKKERFGKILVVKTYDKKRSEFNLIDINTNISKIEKFVDAIPDYVKILGNMDVLCKGDYLDYLNKKKKEELKKLVKFKHEYKKHYDTYLEKYGEEKKVKILIKILNDTIIRRREKSESSFLDEYVGYEICRKLGDGDE